MSGQHGLDGAFARAAAEEAAQAKRFICAGELRGAGGVGGDGDRLSAGRAPAFIGAADLSKLVAEAMDMVMDIAPEGEMPEMPDLSNLPPTMTTLYAGSDPGNWKFGMSIDLGLLVDRPGLILALVAALLMAVTMNKEATTN